jgi:NADH-quinone oxidoreductase subunit G
MTEGNDLINLTIDGIEIGVEPGTYVIDAAERTGVLIPRYCYHPGIPSRPAQCRVCLVEIEGQPKLQPSCKMTAQEGMVVHTASEEAEDARKAVIELLLVNHPLDCPICDAAGQCMLQDYALETEQLRSRLHEEKLVQGRDRIADDILYFADRCIICTRCVRFMSEVAGDEALIVAQRGHRSVIDTFPGRDLDHPFQGNIVDICPVGALVHEDFLFKARLWDLDQAASICPGCSTGCNVTIDVKENQIVRLKPRHNPEVNSYWMCDHGRKHLVMSNRGERAEVPLIRRDGRLGAADWSDALAWVADHLLEVTGGDAVVSPEAANESLFFLRELLDRLGIGGGSFRVPTGEEATLAGFPKLALRAERAPNAAGAELFGFARTDDPAPSPAGAGLIVLEDPLADHEPEWGRDVGFFLYVGGRLSSAARNAHAVLPVTGFAEMQGSFTNFEGRVQRFDQALQPPGLARPAWMILSRLIAELDARRDGETAIETPLEARQAFSEMAVATPELAGLDWDSIGPKGARLAAAGDAVSADVT